MKIVLLTGSELRHTFFRQRLAGDGRFEVVATYCEGLEKSLRAVIEREGGDQALRMRHLAARDRCEEDFFAPFVACTADRSHPRFLPKGDINRPERVQEVIDADADLLVSYGCSIVQPPLLRAYAGRFVNIHLGLSPYYRGSGTNFWPLVNGEPEYVGATFMHIDEGVDTGTIIHQMRARIAWGDTPSQIGNRLIVDMCPVLGDLLVNFDRLESLPPPPKPSQERYYRKKDVTEESVARLYQQLREGLVERYLEEQEARCGRAPLVHQPLLDGAP